MAPDVRFSLDYLEDKVSLVANSMRKMQEKINKRSDDLISKDELEWLFNKFQLRIQGPSMDRLWRHFDNNNTGQVSFASIMMQLDKSHHVRHPEVKKMVNLRSEQTKLPDVAPPGYRPGLTLGAAPTGKLETPTVVQHFGDPHLSDTNDRAPRYVNQFPFHTGQTKPLFGGLALPEKMPHDAFRLDLSSKHPQHGVEFNAAMTKHYVANAMDPRIGAAYVRMHACVFTNQRTSLFLTVPC